VTMTRIERSGRAIHTALQTSSPDEADRFADEYRGALTRAAETLDVSDAEAVLDRWWGIATIRANPLTEDERELVRRVRAGEDLRAGLLVEDPRRQVAGYVLSWVDVAREQYADLPSEVQRLVDLRLADLLEEPDDPRCSEDVASGQWTTTDHQRLG
jgi:hypothetical protein